MESLLNWTAAFQKSDWRHALHGDIYGGGGNVKRFLVWLTQTEVDSCICDGYYDSKFKNFITGCH